MSHPQLLWPHERMQDLNGFEVQLLIAACRSVPLTLLGTTLLGRPGRLRRPLLDAYSRKWFTQLNGSMPRLEGKYQFTQLVCDLGYLAPDSLMVEPGHDTDEVLIGAIEALDPTSPTRLCKPFQGSQGVGLHTAYSYEEALCFIRRQRRSYLVQDYRPPTHGEWRYILHRTAQDLVTNRDPSVRIAALKLGPHVIGDGMHTVRELIALRREWSITDRRKLLIAASTRVPHLGEQVQLVNSGNVSRGLHRFVLPDPDALTCMDDFMLTFLRRLELRTGKFATVCFDVGITPDGPTFYELQIPFGAPYGKTDGVFPEQRRARRSFYQSMQLSGSMV